MMRLLVTLLVGLGLPAVALEARHDPDGRDCEVTGTVRDSTGRPVRDTDVTLAAAGGLARARTQSGHAGEFRLLGVPLGAS